MKKRFLFPGLILIPYFGIILAEENNKDRWIKNNSGTHYSYEQSEFTTFQYNGTEGTLNSYTLDPGNAPDGYSYVAEKTVASAGSLNVNSGTNETTGSGGVKKLKLNGAASATAFIAANTSPVSFTISMNGELSKNGDGNGTVTWSALANSKFFWLEPVEKIVAEGTSVSIAANGAPTESTWSINNAVWKNHNISNSPPYKTSSITLNRDMWDKMKWTPSPVPGSWKCPPAGVYNISATTTEESGARSAAATVHVIKITVDATDLFGTVEKNDDGSNKTAYVHWNIDNDNNANSGGTTKHPGGDYLKANTVVNGEDDLKSFSFTMTPAINKGSIEISIGNNGKVWKSATKGVSSGVNSQLLLDAGATKVWDLSNVAQRNEFNSIGTVYIEGVGNGDATFTIKYKDDTGAEIASDHISYTFIAADCGNQPLVHQKTALLNAFPGLVGCEWSVTGEASILYNCIAWTVGITNMWVNKIGITGPRYDRYLISIDRSYGNNDGTMTMDELDTFYDVKGYYPVTDSSSADIIYYSNYHGARKKNCSDGAGKWDVFESKCGEKERIEHLRDQLNGSEYGSPVRFYKAK
ncbi:MAG: hypothetical protein IJT04_07015 [Bacteroidales bacterium]|nr:hypothetical protein [Bacteroidales bacterium]